MDGKGCGRDLPGLHEPRGAAALAWGRGMFPGGKMSSSQPGKEGGKGLRPRIQPQKRPGGRRKHSTQGHHHRQGPWSLDYEGNAVGTGARAKGSRQGRVA